MSGHLFVQDASNTVRLLKPRMLTTQELDALVFEFVIVYALVVSRHTYGPLLKLTNNALATLFGNS